MGWYFRKSKSFGLFKLNFSKSGLGLSFGVKGARISVNKRGTYVNLGANGFYYRQKVDGKRNVNNNFSPPIDDPIVVNDPLHTITTQDVENITDVDSRDFVDELESKASKISLIKWFGIWPSIILFLYALSFSSDVIHEKVSYKDIFSINKQSVYVRSGQSKESQAIFKAALGDKFTIAGNDSIGWVRVFVNTDQIKTGFVRADMGVKRRFGDTPVRVTRIEAYPMLKYGYAFLALILLSWCIYLRSADRRRKTLEIYYSLDKEISQLHERFLSCFGEFSSSSRIWQNLHVTGVADTKYYAGASQLVSRIKVGGVFLHKLPSPFLKTNVSIPSIMLRNTELYFFPERLIVKRGSSFGAVFYKSVNIERSDTKFIETESLPSDAMVVDHTWKYLNKSGGPDKRFNDNRHLPVCRYSEYTFQSVGGLFEVLTTSKVGAMDHFAQFLKLIGEYQKRIN